MRKIKSWNKWRKNCTNPWYHKLLVLFGIIKSPTFEIYEMMDGVDSGICTIKDILVSPESLETFWSELGDIPVNDDGIIQEPFLWWPKGTDREDIWHWFDERYPGGVIKLMGLKD